MTVTLYRPQKCVCAMVDQFTSVISEDALYIKVFDIQTVFHQHGMLVLSDGNIQTILDTRLFTYYDVI